jgi:hypothetical protein
MIKLEQARLGEDSSLDVLMSEVGTDGKALGEKLNGSHLIGEADKGDFAITPRNPIVVKNEGLRQ